MKRPHSSTALFSLTLILFWGSLLGAEPPATVEFQPDEKGGKDVTAETTASKAERNRKAQANRLAEQTSPYLLMHAYNPVDWYPWGVQAFEKAKQENKPLPRISDSRKEKLSRKREANQGGNKHT